ncbi:MAG: hypothetical protein ABEJ89_09840 [Haloarculaceae archaeon]
MDAWAWLLAYVVGFGLLQLLLFRYFRGEEPSLEASPNPVERPAAAAGEQPREPPEPEEEGVVRCEHCGALNDAEGGYTYCRECVRPLR